MTFFGKATEPEPGDLFVGAMGGLPGVGVEVGQILDGDPFHWVKWIAQGRPEIGPGIWPAWMYEHAGVYLGNMQVAEAEPRGARVRTIPDFDNGGLRYVLWSTGVFPDLSRNQRQMIVAAALQCTKANGGKGIGYSTNEYLYLAMRHFGLSAKWLEDAIADSGEMICSQMDDWCYQQGGYHLFSDGRWNGDVTPQDLAGNMIARARKLGLL